MKLFKIFSNGRVFDEELYAQLKELDNWIFPGCGDEFHKNREWWVMVSRGKIIAYSGYIYSSGVCIFNRAWVASAFRGQGIQKRMIRTRLRAAKKSCKVAITYTTPDNFPSANNLIKCGFLLYSPEYAYAGRQMLYFTKPIQ